MSGSNQVLSVLLAIQIVLGIVVFWPQSTVSGAEVGPLLANFAGEQVASLTVTDSDGNQVTLAKDSDAWVLPEADNYPVDGEKVSSLLDKIGGLQTNRQVTRTESSHRRLKVAEDEFVRLVELKLSDGRTHRLFVGSSPRTSATHIRADNRPETYITANLQSYEVDAKAERWVDTLFYTVPQTATVALTLKNANGEFEFERDEEENWVMKGLAQGEELNQGTINSLLSQATSLRMVSPIGQEEKDWFELDEPEILVTLKTEDGQDYTLQIGGMDPAENNYVAKWSGSPYYVRVAEYTSDNFGNKTREDFVDIPSEATEPAPAGEN